MARNPFIPSEIASRPEVFFGRRKELSKLERSIQQRSITIQGPIGIGKSSLLSRVLLHMEGFESSHNSTYVVATAHNEIDSVDEAARLVLEKFISVDEVKKTLKVNFLKIFEVNESEVYKNFTEGRHLSVLTRILKKDFLEKILDGGEFLIIAIDEVDKAPQHVARLIRVVSNEMQQQGINNVRFIVAGVNPYFKSMAETDPGVTRFFAPPLNVTQLVPEESEELINTKLNEYKSEYEDEGHEVEFTSEIIDVIQRLSGGHPHLIQLLGWHLIENEEDNPDGVLDIKDLTNALRTICYEERVYVYDGMIHQLQIEGMHDKFLNIISSCENALPTIIQKDSLLKICTNEEVVWFVDNNFIVPLTPEEYGMVDEFLRVRVLMDVANKNEDDIEKGFLNMKNDRTLDFDGESSTYSGDFVLYNDESYEHTDVYDSDAESYFDDYDDDVEDDFEDDFEDEHVGN